MKKENETKQYEKLELDDEFIMKALNSIIYNNNELSKRLPDCEVAYVKGTATKDKKLNALLTICAQQQILFGKIGDLIERINQNDPETPKIYAQLVQKVGERYSDISKVHTCLSLVARLEQRVADLELKLKEKE